MKRKIFIGSSSEGFEYAEQIKSQINAQLGDWVECETWRDGKVFVLNASTLESLVNASRKYDYGIMVASSDDVTKKRLSLKNAMRDNVLFEMGLFLGSLGLKRAFLVTHDKIDLPTDYAGVTVVKYNKRNIDSKILEIITAIERTKNSYNLKPLPAVALAYGYFQNLVKKFAERHYGVMSDFEFRVLIPKNISDVYAQVAKYKGINASTKTEGDRPIVFRYDDHPNHFWDIPTTLQTLNDMVVFIVDKKEFGLDAEKMEWVQYELRNFKGTLEMLLEDHGVYQNVVKVEYI